MQYSIDKQEHFVTFMLDEENLNSLLAPNLKAEFIYFKNEGVSNLILDLGKVKFVDSSGLSAILTGNRLWKDEGKFILANIESASVKKLIEISRLESILEIIPTVQEAKDLIIMEELSKDLESE